MAEPAVRLAQDKLSPGRELLLKALSDLPKVTLRTETTCEEIGAGYVKLQSHGRGERLEAGSVVIGGRNLALKWPVSDGKDDTIVLIESNPAADIVGFNDFTTDAAGHVQPGRFVIDRGRP